MKGTTCTVSITRSYLPGLKTSCASTYHKDFHTVARITLVESFKGPGNTSRLLLNSFKHQNTTQGVKTFPGTWTAVFSVPKSIHFSPSPGGVSFSFTSNFHPPTESTLLLTSWQTNQFHCQEKKVDRSVYILSQTLLTRKEVH